MLPLGNLKPMTDPVPVKDNPRRGQSVFQLVKCHFVCKRRHFFESALGFGIRFLLVNYQIKCKVTE